MVLRRAYLSHPASLDHHTGYHPESPERIEMIEDVLGERDWLGWERVEARPAKTAELRAVHPLWHLERLQSLAGRGGGAIDLDTVVSEGSWDAAAHAAGGAAQLVDLLLDGDADVGFVGTRPPGHHAETDRAMGFCLLNNVAVAARRARDAHGAGRVLVLDWDVHHGNGTQAIFDGTSEVLYASIHQWPLYPGTGSPAEAGRGEGRGYTVNLPVPAGTGDDAFASLAEHVVAPIAVAYEPALILISAGYDAHREDPIGGCSVTEGGYAAMSGSIRRAAAELGVPLGVLLEGGYAPGALARSVVATLEVLGADEPPPAPPGLERHPLSDAAAARLAESWPAAVA